MNYQQRLGLALRVYSKAISSNNPSIITSAEDRLYSTLFEMREKGIKFAGRNITVADALNNLVEISVRRGESNIATQLNQSGGTA